VADGVRGTVTAGSPGGSARKLAASDLVYNGETVSTGSKSSVQIRLADGTLLSLGEQSQVEIVDAAYSPDHPDAASAVCRLGRGVFRCLTGEITTAAPDHFRLETPLAVIGVRGTELGVTVGADSVETAVFSGGPGFVIDREGGAPMPAQASKQVQLQAGQGVGKARGAALGQAVAITSHFRSALARVPLRMTPGGPLVPPGKTRGRPAPPRLADLAYKASEKAAGKPPGKWAEKNGGKHPATGADGAHKAHEGQGGFKAFGEKLKNAAKEAGRALEGAVKGKGTGEQGHGRGKGAHGERPQGEGKTGSQGKPGHRIPPTGDDGDPSGKSAKSGKSGPEGKGEGKGEGSGKR
jgi:hypothetical protein